MIQASIRKFSRLAAVVAVGLAMAFTGNAFAQTGNSELGTWKMNPAKSKTNNKDVTNTIEAVGDSIKVQVDVIRADSESHYSYTLKLDGTFVKIDGAAASGDEVAGTRIDANTVRYDFKRAGKTAGSQSIVVSADGKTRTQTMLNASGAPTGTVQVYEKQ
jgi:hypothetical protein